MFLSPIQILKELELPPDARVGDFGAGRGEYSEALAERLGGEGALYALEPFAPHVDALHRKLQRSPFAFYTLHSDLSEIPLRSNLLNGAVVANTLSAITEKEHFVSELARVLEPQGKVLLVDWISSFRNMGPPPESVLMPGEVAELFQGAGFTLGEMLPAGTHHFAFIATSHTP